MLNSKKLEDFEIIDTHQHLWDLSLFQPPWLNAAPDILNNSYNIKKYIEAAKGLDIKSAVYMEGDFDKKDVQKEADYILQLSQDDQTLTSGAVISADPSSASFSDYISQFRGNNLIKGVRKVLHVDSAKKGFCLQSQFIKSMQILADMGISFDLCMRQAELGDAVELATKCKDTLFILDHCGNINPMGFDKPSDEIKKWKEDIHNLAQKDNIICKISGIIASLPESVSPLILAPAINHCLDEFGPDKVVFGSDWPVCLLRCSLKEWVLALFSIISNRTDEQKRKLLSENALKIYNLK